MVLDGQRAVVVGGGSGIGLGSARLLARVAADELGEAGVRVNTIRAGYTITPSTERSSANKPLLQAMLDQQAIPRHGAVDDQAQAVRYLAGPESSWVTGQCLTVDGGHTLRAFPDYRRYRHVADQFRVAREEYPV
jgi:NAD(P)-dependent dehydrogenase (short-subunit alcohol dehydrogenase family)